MKKIIFLFSFVYLFGFTSIDATKANILKLHKENIPIVDIRTPSEWKSTGTIPFAKKIMFFTPRGQINQAFLYELKQNGINKNSKFAVICRTGHRSKVAAKILEDNGYKNVINLKNGMFNLFKDLLKNLKEQ